MEGRHQGDLPEVGSPRDLSMSAADLRSLRRAIQLSCFFLKVIRKWIWLRRKRRFFFSAIDPRHASHNPPPRQFALLAGEKDLAYFVSPVVPALENGQFFAETLCRMAAMGNHQFQHSTDVALHAMSRGGLSMDLRGSDSRALDRLRLVFFFHRQRCRPGQFPMMKAEQRYGFCFG